MSNPQQHSTPNNNRLSSKDTAGNTDFLEIEEEIKADVGNALECDFDELLKYLLQVGLDKNSERKKGLDILQDKIEQLQKCRYYPGTAGGSDGQAITDEENKLVADRTKILDDMLESYLADILIVANNPMLRQHLKDFFTVLNKKGDETHRYAPYVSLCNTALGLLREWDGKRQNTTWKGQKSDELKIVFHRNDPKVIKSKISGLPDIGRKPDVVMTSVLAATDVARIEDSRHFTNPPVVRPEKFSLPPPESFQWPQIFSSTEFKVLKRILGLDTVKIMESGFRFEQTKRVTTVDHNDLETLDKQFVKEALVTATEELPGGTALKPPEATANPNPKITSKTAKPPPTGEPFAKQVVGGRVQLASYALEQLSDNVGVNHVINSLFLNEYLSVWYYDRQGIIGTNGISVVADFPRFLLLLFAFDRFTAEDWGINKCLNPTALRMHGMSKIRSEELPTPIHMTRSTANGYASFKDHSRLRQTPVSKVTLNITNNSLVKQYASEDLGLQEIVIDTDRFLSYKPRTIAGRATAVLEAQGVRQGNPAVEMVCKIYHPEAMRRHEGETLQIVHDIAKTHNADMTKHMPTLYFYGDVRGCTTQRIRSMINESWKGYRTLRIICIKKLAKITSLAGLPFVNAWLEAATCHAFLWKYRVEHGDPSLGNIMYDTENQCGVLTDYDLSILQWEERLFASERTGTIPFMALELLSEEYWHGKLKRRFYHELESFVWVLPYVFLLYQGKIRQKNQLVDVWRTSDYVQCRKDKADFYRQQNLNRAGGSVQKDFKDFWPLAHRLCRSLAIFHLEQDKNQDDLLFNDKALNLDTLHIAESDLLWESFISVLKEFGPKDATFLGLVSRMDQCQPDSRDLTEPEKEALREKYKMHSRNH